MHNDLYRVKRKTLTVLSLYTGLCLGLVMESSWAQSTPPVLTLPAAVGLALSGNFSVRSALAAREAQKFAVLAAEDKFNPQYSLAGSASYDRLREIAYSDTGNTKTSTETLGTSITPTATLETEWGTSFSAQFKNSYERIRDRTSEGAKWDSPTYSNAVELDVTQPLLQGSGREVVTANREITRETEKLNRASLLNSVDSIITQVITAYWQVLLAEKQMEIDTLTLDHSRQYLESNRSLVAAGRMAELDLIQNETSLAQYEYTLDEARNTYRQNKNNLLKLLGLPKSFDFRPAPLGSVEEVNISAETAEDIAMHRRYEPLEAKINREIAPASVGTG